MYTFVIIGVLLLVSLTILLVSQLKNDQELRSRAYIGGAYPTINPSPKPRYIILNSASNKSCSAVCAGLDARCTAVGTTLTTEGKANGKIATKTLDTCQLKAATCDTVAKQVGPPGPCFGQTPEWTFCGCVGKNE